MTSTAGALGRAGLSSAGLAVQGLARFAYTIAIGRLAGPEALGETTALLSVAVYLSLAWPAGLGFAASRYLPLPDVAGQASRALRRSFWVSSAVLSLAAIPLAFWISGDPALAVSCAFLVFGYNAYVFTRGVLMGEDRITWSLIADTFSSFISITALVLVLVGQIDWALLLPLALGYLIFAATSWPRTPPEPTTPEVNRGLVRFTRDTTLSALVTGGLLPSTMIFVSIFDSPEQTGLFAAALSLATPASLVSQAVNQVLIPHFARMDGDRQMLRSAHVRLFLITVLPFTVVFGALIALSPWILTTLYGDRYSGGATAMQILLVIVFLMSCTAAPSAVLVASGHQKLYARIWVVAFIAGVTTMLICAPLWGQWGALLGYGIGAGGGSLCVIVTAFAVLRPSPFDKTPAPESRPSR